MRIDTAQSIGAADAVHEHPLGFDCRGAREQHLAQFVGQVLHRRLPDDVQRTRVHIAATEAAAELAQLAQKEHEASLLALRKRGMIASQLSLAERAAFAAAARPVYDRWAAAAGADLARAAEAAVSGVPP